MKFIFCLVLLLLAPCLSAEEVKPTVVPFDLVGTDVIVKATINGKAVRLVVDTGAWKVALRPEDAALYRLSPPESGTEEYANPGSLTVQIGGLRWNDVSSSFLPKGMMSKSLPYAGLLGLEQMREYAVGFDLQTKRLTFWKGGNLSKAQMTSYLALSGNPAPTSTLELEEGEDANYKTVIRLDNQRVKAIIDTGSPLSFFGRGVAKAMHPLRQTERHEARFIAGTVPAKFSLMRLVQVGQFALPYLTVSLSDDNKETDQNQYDILGMDVLHQTRFLFDFPALKLHLKPIQTPWLRLTSLWRQLGINVLSQDVIMVYSETAAAFAGLPFASQLLCVNGTPLSRVRESSALAARLLQSPSFTFTVLEEGKMQTVSRRVASRERLNAPLLPFADTAPLESSVMFTTKNASQPYSLAYEQPIVVSPDADIRVDENLVVVEDPPTGKYPYGATVYTPAYTGKFPDVPTARWRALGRGVIAILNAPPSTR